MAVRQRLISLLSVLLTLHSSYGLAIASQQEDVLEVKQNDQILGEGAENGAFEPFVGMIKLCDSKDIVPTASALSLRYSRAPFKGS